MSVMIRDAAEEDLPFLLKIYGYYVENTGYSFEYTVPSEEDFLNRFKTITEAYPWLVLLDEGKITGYAYASRAFQRAAYQWDADVTVYLDNTCHRKGYASLLYEKLLAILDIQGYYTVYAGKRYKSSKPLFHQSKDLRRSDIFVSQDLRTAHGLVLSGWRKAQNMRRKTYRPTSAIRNFRRKFVWSASCMI